MRGLMAFPFITPFLGVHRNEPPYFKDSETSWFGWFLKINQRENFMRCVRGGNWEVEPDSPHRLWWSQMFPFLSLHVLLINPVGSFQSPLQQKQVTLGATDCSVCAGVSGEYSDVMGASQVYNSTSAKYMQNIFMIIFNFEDIAKFSDLGHRNEYKQSGR